MVPFSNDVTRDPPAALVNIGIEVERKGATFLVRVRCQRSNAWAYLETKESSSSSCQPGSNASERLDRSGQCRRDVGLVASRRNREALHGAPVHALVR